MDKDLTLADRPRVGRGFWSVAAAVTAIVLGANTPLPLLTVYQSEWGFSTAVLSIVYGLYTVGVVTTVFLVGPLSNRSGVYLATYVELTAYAVAGTFAGLGASFAKILLGIQGHFAAGLVVALLFLASAAGQLVVRRWPLRRAMLVGLLTLLAGLICFAGALVGRSGALFFPSAVILGAGHGLAYLGSQELTDRIAPRQSRAEVFSAFQLGLYVGATMPAVVVGFAAKALGFETATLIFVAAIAALAVVGLIWIRASPLEALQA